jgi:DeoR/GlpR family transcriptional regulator of sugar metabolism
MEPENRREAILEALLSRGQVEIAELSDQLGVSDMTIRRDLAALEGEGVLRRVHGGATRVLSGTYEPPFAVRARLHRGAKEAIAREVATQVTDGEAVIVDGGTTGLAIASALADRVITVCPLSLRVTNVLAEAGTVRLLVPGGFVRPRELSFVGQPVIRSLEEHVFDTYVIKRAALQNANRCILACDSSKFGESAFTKIAPFTTPDLVVTDAGISDEIQDRLLDAGVKLVIAETPAP